MIEGDKKLMLKILQILDKRRILKEKELQKYGISKYDWIATKHFMVEQNMIEVEGSFIRFTKYGKEYLNKLTEELRKDELYFMREREIRFQKQQSKFNKLLIIATFLIASFGYIQAYPTILKISEGKIMQQILLMIYVVTVFLIIISMVYLLINIFILFFGKNNRGK